MLTSHTLFDQWKYDTHRDTHSQNVLGFIDVGRQKHNRRSYNTQRGRTRLKPVYASSGRYPPFGPTQSVVALVLFFEEGWLLHIYHLRKFPLKEGCDRINLIDVDSSAEHSFLPGDLSRTRFHLYYVFDFIYLEISVCQVWKKKMF